jgi:hypothetical protein
MTAARPPVAEHVQFDALCEGLDEYDALPTMPPEPPQPVQDHDEDGRSERLDDQILAGLVSP